MPGNPSDTVQADFLNSVPPPLAIVLVRLAPLIALLRQTAETLSWKSSPYDSWLVVGAWWFICLLCVPVIKYLLPIAIILTVAISRWTFPLQYSPSPVTEHHLQNTIADLITIHSLLPFPPSIPPLTTRPESILRILSIIYIPYLLVTHLVAIPTLIAIAGTFVFTHRAPWASTARRILWSSAHIRWGLYQAYAFLSGDPLPVAYQQMSNLHPPKSSGIRFLFTIYENQRWWMGLDWVPALLPAERPSWCSADLQPVSPPHAFTLPPETSVVMSDGKGGKVKRTAQWDWVDFEWRVVVKIDGERPAVLLEHTLLKEEMKEKDVHSSPKVAESGSKSALASPSNEVQEEWENIVDHDHVTDSDGWVYGDNKWEHPGNKGGIGKYTRYRRWTRVAVLSEFVDHLSASDLSLLGDTTGVTTDKAPSTPEKRTASSNARDTASGSTALAQPDNATGEIDKSHERNRLHKRPKNSDPSN